MSVDAQKQDKPALPGDIDFGRKVAVLRVQGGTLSGRIDVRAVAVIVMLVAAALVVAVFALGTGDYPVSPDRVVQAIFADQFSGSSGFQPVRTRPEVSSVDIGLLLLWGSVRWATAPWT